MWTAAADRPCGIVRRSCLHARACVGTDHDGRGRNILTRCSPRSRRSASELAADTDIDAMAWYYLGVLQAVLNFPQVGADPSILDRMIDVAMSVWPSTLLSDS